MIVSNSQNENHVCSSVHEVLRGCGLVMRLDKCQRELGLLRKRSSSTSAVKRLTKANQLFTHLIVIDFESTCWKDQKFKTQEIIEFPAVLLDTRTGDIVDEFHHYVQPQESPTLSAFCKQLTGITQEQVDDGIPLNFCLSRFNQWLKRLAGKYNIIFYNSDNPAANRCTFVTWSDWDLSVCLHYECKRKQLRKPAELNSWIDLRAVYRKFYSRKPQGLNGALKDVGIIFEGREHSGVCDARNTAKLAHKMMQDGCIMMITWTLGNGPMPPPRSIPPPPPPTTVASTSSDQPTKPAMKRAFSAPSLQQTPVKSPSKPQIKKQKLSNSPTKPGKEGTNSELEELEMLLTLSPHTIKLPNQDTEADNVKSLRKVTVEEAIDNQSSLLGNQMNRLRKSTLLKTGASEGLTARRSISQCIQLLTASNNSAPSGKSTKEKDIHDDSPKTSATFPVPITEPELVKTPMNQSKIVPISTFNIHTDNGTASTKNIPGKTIMIKDITNTTPAVKSVAMKVTSNENTTPVQRTIESCFKIQSTKTPFVKQTPNQPFKTPSNVACNPSGLKRTPPLCDCGRRSHRKMVQNPGPNVGRFFFACPLGRKGAHKKSGCGFFKWEGQIMTRTSNKSSPVLPQTNIRNFTKSVPLPCNKMTSRVIQTNSKASPVLPQANAKDLTNSVPVPSNKVTSHVIHGMSYTSRTFESPLPQPNFNTPLSERVGSFSGANQASVIANGRANTVLKPPMF